MKGHLGKYMSETQYAVMMDLWNVDELGKVNRWVSDNNINLEVAVNDPTLLQLRELIDKQNGVDNHMYGITSTEWRVFWENSLEIPPAIALKFQTDLHKCTQTAIHILWKARNTAVHGKTTPSELWELRIFEEAIHTWKLEVERKGQTMVEGAEARIRSLPRKQKLKWLHNRFMKQKSIQNSGLKIKLHMSK